MRKGKEGMEGGALDFSKAFDTVRHVNLLQKLASLDIPDCVYKWLAKYFFWSFSLYCLPWRHIFLVEYISQHYVRISTWTSVIRCQRR